MRFLRYLASIASLVAVNDAATQPFCSTVSKKSCKPAATSWCASYLGRSLIAYAN
jgi:hypothetical protein